MSTSKVEATLQAAGKQAELVPSLILLPRAPLGPSEVLFSNGQLGFRFTVAYERKLP
jgi:hypothetical protein